MTPDHKPEDEDRARAREGAQLPQALNRLSWVYDLYRLGAIIGLGEQRRQFQRDVLEHIVEGVGASTGSLALVDDEKKTLLVAACVGLTAEVLGQQIDMGEGVLGRVATEGKPLLLIGDLEQDERFGPETSGPREKRPASAMVWPLRSQGSVTGILSVNRDDISRPFTQSDLEHGQALLHLVTIAIENTRLQEGQQKQIERLARMNTEILAMNKRVDEARLQLMQSEQMAALGRLAAGVAHEINNPLAYISSNVGTLSGYLESLFGLLGAYESRHAGGRGTSDQLEELQRRINPEFRQDLQSMIAEVEGGVDRVKNIVRELRLFSHSGEGEWQQVDLHEALDSAVKFAGPAMSDGIVVEKKYDVIEPVECILAEINQVFLNLIVNAAQAMGETGKLRIATAQQDQWVSVAITDIGTGIREENLSRVFEPFYTSKPPGQGTGLGLSLSYSIVRKHQGRILVKSKPREGSTFTVSLPVRQSSGKAA